MWIKELPGAYVYQNRVTISENTHTVYAYIIFVQKEKWVIYNYVLTIKKILDTVSSMGSVEVSRGRMKILASFCILKYRYPIIKNNVETLRLYDGTRHRGREIEGNSCVDMGYTTPVLVCRHAPRELWGLGLPLSINPSLVGWQVCMHVYMYTWSLHSSWFKKRRTAIKI